jgi:hypothetical protein
VSAIRDRSECLPIPTGLHHSARGCRVGEATPNAVHLSGIGILPMSPRRLWAGCRSVHTKVNSIEATPGRRLQINAADGGIAPPALSESALRASNDIRLHFVAADGGGFEPPIPCGIHAFQACAIDHSATHPSRLAADRGRWDTERSGARRNQGTLKQKQPRDLAAPGLFKDWEWEFATLSFPTRWTLGARPCGRLPAPRRCSPRQAEYAVSQQDRSVPCGSGIIE